MQVLRFFVTMSRERVSFGGIQFNLLNARGPWLNAEVLVRRRDFPQHCCCEGVEVQTEQKVHLLKKNSSSTGYVGITMSFRVHLISMNRKQFYVLVIKILFFYFVSIILITLFMIIFRLNCSQFLYLIQNLNELGLIIVDVRKGLTLWYENLSQSQGSLIFYGMRVSPKATDLWFFGNSS